MCAKDITSHYQFNQEKKMTDKDKKDKDRIVEGVDNEGNTVKTLLRQPTAQNPSETTYGSRLSRFTGSIQ